MPTVKELRAQVARLQEQLAVAESREGPSPNDMGVAGRIAITRLRDTDYPELVASVERIPQIYREEGYSAALAFCRTVVRSQIDSLILANPRTGDLVRAQHRIHMLLNRGFADVLMLNNRAGVHARADLLECVERYAFAPSVKAAFAKGQESPAGLFPSVPSG